MRICKRNVSVIVQRASAVLVATVLGCGAASAQEIDFKKLPQNVKDAFKTIEAYLTTQKDLGQEIAIADFTTIDRSSGAAEPSRAIVVDATRAQATLPGKKKVNKNVTAMDGSTETTFVITGSPECQLKQAGGTYYWVPSPPCP
jgi:hypothetical protein